MGLAGETMHQMEAEDLEKVLIKGIKTNNQDIVNFLKENVYPMYQDHVAETWGAYKETKLIKENYGGKE